MLMLAELDFLRTRQKALEYDHESFSTDQIYTKSGASVKRNIGIYGSDYLIKEVLAFDYSIEKEENY